MIDFFPSLACRYPNKKKTLPKKIDGVNSIFSNKKNKFSVTESQYNARTIPERPYEIIVRNKNNQLYSINSFKKDKIVKTNNFFLNKNQKKIKINEKNVDTFNQLIKLKSKHIKYYD